MVKALQLLSVVVPSMSVKLDDPQVLLQMANVHRHGTASTQQLQNGAHALETRMEALLSEAVASGTDPSEKLTDVAYQTMLTALTTIEDQLDTEKDQNIADWKDANDAVVLCGTTMQNELTTQADPLETAWMTSKGVHATCRQAEDTANDDEKTKHTTMTSKTRTAANAKPTELTEVICDGDLPEDPLAKANKILAALEAANTWADAHTSGLDTAITQYDSAKETSDGKATECDDKQFAFEKDFCLFDAEVTTICAIRSSCVVRETENRRKKQEELQAKVTAEKIILKSCSKVRCYLGLIKGQVTSDGDLKKPYTITEDMYNACRDGEGTYNNDGWNAAGPDDLNIEYPLSDPETCAAAEAKIVVTPDNSNGKFDDGWYNTHYGDLNFEEANTWMAGRAGLEDIMKCHNHLSTAAPPAGCQGLPEISDCEDWSSGKECVVLALNGKDEITQTNDRDHAYVDFAGGQFNNAVYIQGSAFVHRKTLSFDTVKPVVVKIAIQDSFAKYLPEGFVEDGTHVMYQYRPGSRTSDDQYRPAENKLYSKHFPSGTVSIKLVNPKNDRVKHIGVFIDNDCEA